MTFDQRPPTVPLHRRLAQASRGARQSLADGIARLLGVTMQVQEAPPAEATDHETVPPRPTATAPAMKEPAPAPEPQPAAAPSRRPDRFSPDPAIAIRIDACPVCGDPLEVLVKDDYCPGCNSPARTRILPPLLDSVIGPAIAQAGVADLPLLGFAMAGAEKKMIARVFPVEKSVSLFGNYGGDHEIGVDARDLSRYADNSFSGHFSILLFDYFTEQDQAIREAFRVLAPGGVFFTQLGPYRLLDGWDAPYQVKEVRGRPGYFEYLPEGVALADIRVGRQWFLQAMEDAGFRVRWVRAHDRAAGADLDWFVGVKPQV